MSRHPCVGVSVSVWDHPACDPADRAVQGRPSRKKPPQVCCRNPKGRSLPARQQVSFGRQNCLGLTRSVCAHAEGDHQEHEPDFHRRQVDHAVRPRLFEARRRGSPMQVGLSEASPAEYFAPRDHPGISQNDEKGTSQRFPQCTSPRRPRTRRGTTKTPSQSELKM